jgi:hypothetical protein
MELTRDLFKLLRKWQSRTKPKFYYEPTDGNPIEVCDVTIIGGFATLRLSNNQDITIKFTEKSTMFGFIGEFGYDSKLGLESIYLMPEVYIEGDYIKDAKLVNSLIRDYPATIKDDRGMSFDIIWSDWYSDRLELILSGLKAYNIPLKNGRLDGVALFAHEDGIFTIESFDR